MSAQKHVPKHRPECITAGGLLIPKYIFEEDKCLEGLGYNPRPDDIFIVTYPKSGTTWTQYIVWEIMNSGAAPPGMNDMLTKLVPYLEFTGTEPVEKLTPPRAMKTHIPYHLHPYHHLAKYIYIARNPKDTCVSFYHHHKEMPSMYDYEEGTLDDFFECFLVGDVSYGDWFDHVRSWYVHKDDPNVLFLTYEDMKRDPKGNILKIAQFLGDEHEQKLVRDPDLLSRIVEYTSFENMKKLEFYMPKENTDVELDGEFKVPKNENDAEKFKKVNFFWRGKVGNWKEYLSDEQVERLSQMIRNRPRGEEIAALWSE